MRKWFFIFIMLLFPLAASAQVDYGLVSPSVDPAGDARVFAKMRSRMETVRSRCGRPTVAVVLSGGGAKGAAHVGVLRRLEEKGIPVDMILGTSMGGLVGGLYALGYDSFFLDSLVRSFDWDLMLSDEIDPSYIPYSTKMRKEKYNILVPVDYDFKPIEEMGEPSDKKKPAESLPAGWVSGINVENVLAKLTVGYRDSISFMDLPIPYCCVAADLVSGKSKNWTSGDLAVAMRSTMSIPGLFNPVRVDGMVLVDGGTRNNFPTDIARAMGADIVIGVVLSQVDESEISVNNIGDIISQLIDMLSREAYEKNIMDADVQIHPDLHEYNMMSFNNEAIDTIINRGYAAALACERELGLVARRTAGRRQMEKKAPAIDLGSNSVRISDIEFPGKKSIDERYLIEMTDINPGDSVSAPKIENAVSTLFGTGSFKNVTYALKDGGDDGYRLVFDLTDGPVHRFGMGGRIDSEDMVAALMEVSINAYRLSGSKFDFEARIGQNWYAQAHYALVTPDAPAYNLSLRTGKNMANMIIGDSYCDAGFWHHRADLFINGLRSSNFDLTGGLRYDYYGLNSWLSEKSIDDRVHTMDNMDTYRRSFFTVYGSARAYTMDDKYFPTKGFSLGVQYEWVLGRDMSQVIAIDYRDHFRLNDWLALLPSLYLRYLVSESATLDNNLFLANFAGGAVAGRYFDQQMSFSGFHRCTVLDDFSVDFELDFRANPFKNAFFSVKAGVIQSAPEIAVMFGDGSSAIFGGALEAAYKAFFGPVKFDLQYSNIGGLGAYFSLGYDF